jgi:hypothetical protein
MQTLAVLNPLSRIDQHIMDDADLAGPVLYFLLFGFFLLFVSPALVTPSAPDHHSPERSISAIFTVLPL